MCCRSGVSAWVVRRCNYDAVERVAMEKRQRRGRARGAAVEQELAEIVAVRHAEKPLHRRFAASNLVNWPLVVVEHLCWVERLGSRSS